MQAIIDDLVDASVIGIENLRAPHLRGFAHQAFIAGDGRCFADARDRTCGTRGAIAVDYQPRVALRDQVRIELPRQRLRDAGDADIPGDMANQLALRQPEIAKLLWNQPAVMVAGEEIRRAPRGIMFVDRGNIFVTQK